MGKSNFKIGWVRVAVAVILSFLFLAILIPNTGTIITVATIPPTRIVEHRPQQIALLVAMLLVPLSCIYLGARRFRILELIGWSLLVGLFILATQK
jgi:hypothetical protein